MRDMSCTTLLPLITLRRVQSTAVAGVRDEPSQRCEAARLSIPSYRRSICTPHSDNRVFFLLQIFAVLLYEPDGVPPGKLLSRVRVQLSLERTMTAFVGRDKAPHPPDAL